MVDAHLPLLIVAGLALGLGVLILVLSAFLGPKRPSEVKAEAFECGNPSSGDARDRFNVRYFLVAILFLVFDIEAVFIYPWAVTFSDAVRGVGSITALVAMIEMLTFVGILLVGLTYVWRKGALEWGPEAARIDRGIVDDEDSTKVRKAA